jgi:hypothetical protein
MQGLRLLALLLRPQLVITTRHSNFNKSNKLLLKKNYKRTFQLYLMHGDSLYKANKTNHLLEREWHSSYHNSHHIPARICTIPKAFLPSIMRLYLLLQFFLVVTLCSRVTDALCFAQMHHLQLRCFRSTRRIFPPPLNLCWRGKWYILSKHQKSITLLLSSEDLNPQQPCCGNLKSHNKGRYIEVKHN